MYKNLTLTAFVGALAVILGAFGAHALKETLSEAELNSFETAVRYQLYHVIILLIVNLNQAFSLKEKRIMSYLFWIGILFFSGSIYAMYLAKVPAKSIWFITPLGGLLLILGWFYLGVTFFRKSAKK
ncbi:DUF423 domain-containing protein [uncultured Tenacibaculum sp.]|uniref:DUF423 domain-containing protein n=1 Tax=uncultured Tenacibaculum sp. TaxID=174713 RepID=UPI0026267F16|nr:DUF423 domain-containing protein [uncultured Tenacibaculum sp.]